MAVQSNTSSSKRKTVEIAQEVTKFGLVLIILSVFLDHLDKPVLALEVAAVVLILGPQFVVLRYSKRKSERHSAMRTLGLVLLLLLVRAVYLYLA